MKKINTNQKGILIIEMMIGILIAMFSVLAVYSLYANFEAQKRTTVYTGGALQNATLALFQIEHDARDAGYGINNTSLMGCVVRTWDEVNSAGFNFTLAPANIKFGASNTAPDSIIFISGNSDNAFNSLKISANQAVSTDIYQVDNRYGMLPGELLIIGETGKDCSLIQIAGLPTGSGFTSNILHTSGTYTDPGGATATTQFNNPAGSGVVYSIAARVTNLGAIPNINTYSIINSQLNFKSGLGSAGTATPVSDQIVHMQAVYGKDTNADGIVDRWDRTPPVSGAAWAQVISIRVAVLARSAVQEKPDAITGICNATANNLISWNSGVAGVSMDISGLPNWQCYRYRVMHTTIPLRNMIWNGTM